MTLQSQLTLAFTAVGTEVKATKTKIGDLSALNTAAKGSTVAAINEVNTKPAVAINDSTSGSTSTYSSDKINAAISAAITALVNGSPTALDTLKELSDALGADANFAATTSTALGNRVRYDATQTLTAPQTLQARTNINAAGLTTDLGDPTSDFAATFAAALV